MKLSNQHQSATVAVIETCHLNPNQGIIRLPSPNRLKEGWHTHSGDPLGNYLDLCRNIGVSRPK
jgi:hypothetical protein